MSEHSAAGSAPLYCPEDTDEVVQSHPDAAIPYNQEPDDESTINHLFDSESHHMPSPDYLLRRLCLHHLTSRQDSINWILKVHARYDFKPATALLAVNYFDRFLSSYHLPGNGWQYQLLSVACLSLAAKMEEPRVPLLIDLQIMDPTYVFDPKTVQRMELLVMANLDWRLSSVTPFDFLHYFISKLSPLSAHHHASPQPPHPTPTAIHILSTSSDLVLNTIRVIDFVRISPSVIAAAAVVSAAGKELESLPLTFYERVEKEMVRSCHQLMEEYLVDTCPRSDRKVRSRMQILAAAPPSPVGVLESAACVSCDTRSENPCSAAGSGTIGAAQEHEPPQPKRLRSSVGDIQELQR
ncbi:cyclin-D4-1-like [Coffea eugenioides]|uniref:cyclin-D4-1-like n=1 Tax=Coffea eugenioides TaxID=49369 RepID=UPI000F60762F|nr:cyclin-D4-1-like [Coffea eugenioides]